MRALLRLLNAILDLLYPPDAPKPPSTPRRETKIFYHF